MSTEPKKELSPEDDLKNVMAQIQAMENNKDLAQSDGDSGSPNTAAEQVKSPPAESPNDGETAALPLTPPVSPSAAPSWLHNIVEVTSKDSPHFGVIFRLGDMRAGKAHGYILKARGAREYITVAADHISTVGKAKVKAGRYCSGQWASEHRE